MTDACQTHKAFTSKREEIIATMVNRMVTQNTTGAVIAADWILRLQHALRHVYVLSHRDGSKRNLEELFDFMLKDPDYGIGP